MGITKTSEYASNQLIIANRLKALGHPARIAIIDILLQRSTCICGELVNELPLSQPTISQHLKELKTVGLIKGSIEGTSVCYCLDNAVFSELITYFDSIKLFLQKPNSECC
jgi:DNA-binding transcriptional ArsR family regulator